MKEIQQELHTWLFRTTAKCREVESLLGKLQFIAKCIKAGRIFLSRLIIRVDQGHEQDRLLSDPRGGTKGHCLVGQVCTAVQWSIHPVVTQSTYS